MVPSSPVAEFLRLPFPLQLTIGLLILVALQQFRQGHIGRVGIASAGVLVVGKGYPVWNQLHDAWRLYVVVAGVMGAIATVSYVTKTSLSTEFYRFAFVFLGGISVILVFVYGFPL